MKKSLLILAIGWLVLGVIAVAGCGSQKTVENTNKNTEIKTKVTTNSSKNNSPAVKGVVGESIKVGNVEVKVNKWEFKDKIGSSEPPSGKKYMFADVEVVNNGDKPIEPVNPSALGGAEGSSAASPWSIRTSEGYTYPVYGTYTDSDAQPYFSMSPIDPGDKTRGNIISEVPTNVGEMELEFYTSEGRAKIALH